MATFSRAPKETYGRLRAVVRECYPDLEELMARRAKPLVIDILDIRADLDAKGDPVGPAIKHGGYAVAADIRIQPKALRALGLGAVLLRIDADKWPDLKDEEKDALLDHELYHLVPRRESDEPEAPWKNDDLGYPMFAGMRMHDVEVGWFVEVAKRRGFASVEVQQAKKISDKWGQFLFNFATTENLPGLKISVGAPEPKGKPEPQSGDDQVERWALWEQLTEEQREEAEAMAGPQAREGQIGLDDTGTVLACRPIPASEQEAAPEPRQGRAAASKGSQAGGAKAGKGAKPAAKKGSGKKK